MKLSVPANYDPDLIDQMAEYPVEEVYGRLPVDFIGGGRPSYMAGRLNRKKLTRYVRCLREHKIAFNYLLNSACLANREWSRSWQTRLDRFLDELWDTGIERLTVSSPYLLERVKSRLPQFHIRIGIFAQIDTPRRARFWQNAGADALTLESFTINRDFATLASIRRAVTCDLHLIANHPCLPNCPLQVAHQNGFAHASNGDEALFIDYCFLTCTLMRLRDPALFIKSAWIRPEDIACYERLGYTHFKLLERDIPSADLLARIRAYSTRRSPENFADLILPYGFGRTQPKPRFWLLRNFFKPSQVSPLQLSTLRRFAKKAGMLYGGGVRPVQIDAAKLPADFLEMVSAPCKEDHCQTCRRCDDIAKTAVRLREPAASELAAMLTHITRQLKTGSFWNV